MKTLLAAIHILAEESFTKEDAQALGEKIGIDWDSVSFTPEQFQVGITMERKEHMDDPETAITDDIQDIGKVAWSHLKESPIYYDKLPAFEKSLEDGEVEKEALYPETDPMITRGESPQSGHPQNDSLLEPRWVGHTL